MGTGVFNGASKIAVRLLAPRRAGTLFGPYDAASFEYLHTPQSAAFFSRAVRRAWDLRALSFREDESFRLIFAEADGIPGFIADRFVDSQKRVILAVQFLSLSCEVFRDEILGALTETARPWGVFERSDAAQRQKEGLEARLGWLGEERESPIIIEENQALFYVDIAAGQKTGFYLDQKRNRAVAARFAPGRRVLDLFCHTGAFALAAAKAGAREVTACDISPEAAALAEKNIALNGLGAAVKVIQADAFKLLREYEAQGRQFDMVILDPSAFAKSAKTIDKAYGGYKEINLRAMKLLSSGGILVSCSCSHFFDAPRFYALIGAAARDAGKRVWFLEKRGPSEDHPVLAGCPSSEYLKCAVCVVDGPA